MELKAENIGRRYLRQAKSKNVFWAVRDVSLTLKGGAVTAVTGRSGSGKSTLLHLLAGGLEPTEGRVLLGEHDLYVADDGACSRLRNDHIGVVPQGHTALGALTVRENVLLPAMLAGQGDKEERATELMMRLGIADLASVYPRELSGGELRRVAIARAHLNAPDILLADEPTADLDDENTEIVLELFKEAGAAGAAVLIVTHDKEAAAVADVVYTMDGGSLRPSDK